MGARAARLPALAGRLAAFAIAAVALALPAAPARGAELVEIAVPSRHVDPDTVAFNGSDHPRELRATVLLPDGYDGRRRFPVLWLLHGVGDHYRSWSQPARGDVERTLAGLGAIVVMPEAARGFYANWWNGGRRAEPAWERYYLEELIPELERRLRILPGRSNRAVAGLSMGGLGAMLLASRLPGYFGSAASFSGLVSHQRPESESGLRAVAGVEYSQIFGPVDGFYATGHNPTRLVGNLRATRVYATVGDGTPDPAVETTPAAAVGGGAAEAWLRTHADEFVAAAREAGVDITYRPRQGNHDWPYWRAHLRDAVEWGLFRPVGEEPRRWEYATVSQRGEAWGIRFAFERPPDELVRLSRDGGRLRGEGSGAATLEPAEGCVLRVRLPFERRLPRSGCGGLRLVVRPRGLRAGSAAVLRVSATTLTPGGRVRRVAGARVRAGGRSVRTNRRGRATLRVTPARAGRLVVRGAARGLRPGRAALRVRR